MRCIIFLALVYRIASVPIDDEAFSEFKKGNHKFTADLYKEILKNEKGNFIASPLSAEIILALTNEGARGNTSAELVTALSLPTSNEKIRRALRTFLPNLKRNDENLQLLAANKIYTGKGLLLEDDFKTIATNVYDSGVEGIDFAKNKEAAATINDWVEDHTNHKIKNLINPDSIDQDTRIVLVNALYFSGQWVSKFKSYRTKKEVFYKTKNDVIEVDSMHQTEYFNYYENPTLNAKFLKLPYKGGADINMVIVLPKEIEGLSILEERIDQLLAPQPYVRERVDVQIPKFTIETQIPFIPILKSLGVKHLFDDADLSGLSSTDKNIYVSEVIQKAFINVSEAGTEAAAATAVGVALYTAYEYNLPPKIFRADHPFLYYIESNGVVIFIGHCVNS